MNQREYATSFITLFKHIYNASEQTREFETKRKQIVARHDNRRCLLLYLFIAPLSISVKTSFRLFYEMESA